MRRAVLAVLILLASLLVATPAGAAPDDDVYRYLDDPRLTGEGQESPHAVLRPYPDEPAAVAQSGTDPLTLSLNGAWRLKMYDKPDDVPAAFHEDGFDPSGFPSVSVPHTWQSDFIDHPIFRNIPTEIVPDDPPRVPRDVNPTGAYLKTFTLPANWSGGRMFLRFEGVTSNYLVWVNGAYVGYDQGGYTPAEYDVTDRLRPGRNTIAVQVHRWGSGAYLEDVDQWRYSGIFRDVWLYRTPQSRIRDAYVTTDLDAGYRNAVLTARVDTVNPAGDVRATLFDGDRKITEVAQRATERTTLTLPVTDPAKWSAEDPHLYTLVLRMGEHVTQQRVGFREIEVRDETILVNGKRILIKGVNRAETDPDTGRHVTRAAMRRDVFLMKRLHVNAVRTSHYPSDPYLYDLADEHGLWIDDEVDIETHNRDNCPSNCLADRPEWQAAFADRFRAMVERDKNHPSVIFWDTGNEAGLGAAHYAMAAWADANEPTRLLYHQANNPDGDAPYADVDGPRYPTPARLESRAQSSPKPIVMGEYAHAMGNGLGNFDQFWALTREHPSIQGGFIWDWAEQNLRQPLYTLAEDERAFLVGKPTVADGAIDLSGLDDFVDVFRDPGLDLTGPLRLAARVKPGAWSGSFPILTKGLGYALQMRDRDTLEFGVDVDGWTTVAADVPADWYENWHEVSGEYDGTTLRLFIDGAEKAAVVKGGTVDPGLFEVNLGHNAQTQRDNDLWNARTGHGRIDWARIYGAGPEPVLSLDFDRVRRRGDFLSLGISLSGTDGLVGSDRYVQPETAEMAWAQAPIRVSRVDADTVRVTNEQTTGTFATRVRWALTEQERTLRSGTRAVTLGPGESADLDVRIPANPQDRERFLTVTAQSAEDRPWARAGWVLGHDQFAAGGRAVPGVLPLPVRGAPRSVSDVDGITVSGDGFRYRFTDGQLTSMRAGGRELLRGAPALSVIRPPTSNETYDWGTDDRRVWHDVGLDALRRTTLGVHTSPDPDAVVLLVTERYTGRSIAFDQTMTYRIDRRGTITLRQEVTPSGAGTAALPYLPRVGLSMRVPQAMKQFAYYGRGPRETYNDRKSGSAMGVYRSTVDDEYVRYSRPQAYGNHTDARWAALTDGRDGLLVGGMNDVSVTPYDDLDRAEYDHQLPRVRNNGWVTLHALAGETGMGETPNSVLPPYFLPANRPYAQELVLRPLTGAEAGNGGVPDSDVPAPCPPAVTVDAPATITPGTATPVAVRVAAGCEISAADVALAVPAGWTVTPASVRLTGPGTATFQVTAPAGTDVGTHALTATVVSRTPAGFVTTTTASAQVATPLPAGWSWVSDRQFQVVTNGWGPVERDMSNGEQPAGDGEPLTIAGRAYPKGLGVHALSRVTLALGGTCTRLRADTGVDDETGGDGSVVFSVWRDGTKVWESGRLTGADAAEAADVDLTGGQTLELRVEDAGDGNAHDHADWAAARLAC